MLIPELHRHLAVCRLTELPANLRRDRKFWTVISILEPSTLPPPLQGAKRVHELTFHDVEDEKLLDTEGTRLASVEDISAAQAFVDGAPQEPILIHCRAGISRSTALAVVLLVRGHLSQGSQVNAERIVDPILDVRRQAIPNVLVMKLGFGLFMQQAVAVSLTREIASEPRVINNRFVNPKKYSRDHSPALLLSQAFYKPITGRFR